MKRWWIVALAAAALVGLAGCGGDGEGDGDNGPLTLKATNSDGKSVEVTVELAVTTAERARGLMEREELAEDAGMLFVFNRPTTAPFWMKDTPLPLSIAFIDADGTVLEIRDMEALSTELTQPSQSYNYALEVNQGWFAEQGIETGDRFEIPEEIRTPEPA